MAKKERKRVPDGLRDIAADLLREELHLSPIDLDKSHISGLFKRSGGERDDSLLSIWFRTISSESVETFWSEAARLQGQSEGSGVDVDPDEKNDDLHRTCTTALKRIIRDDLPADQQEVVKHLLLQQQESLTESMADLSVYAQGVLMKVVAGDACAVVGLPAPSSTILAVQELLPPGHAAIEGTVHVAPIPAQLQNVLVKPTTAEQKQFKDLFSNHHLQHMDHRAKGTQREDTKNQYQVWTALSDGIIPEPSPELPTP
ncbi:hypothetical protein BGZ70_006044, partial [Mortierella alpina]